MGESADDDEEEDEDEETVDSLTAAEALAPEPGELSALDREVSGVELRSMESSAASDVYKRQSIGCFYLFSFSVLQFLVVVSVR